MYNVYHHLHAEDFDYISTSLLCKKNTIANEQTLLFFIIEIYKRHVILKFELKPKTK
jgi:hypothetical protein